MASSDPRLVGIYETVLYASDVVAAARFYSDVLGLRLLGEPDQLSAAFRLDDGGIFLVFDPERASAPGRAVPSHGTTGSGHVAFATELGFLDGLAVKLHGRGVEIEREVAWDEGGRSLYVRDPAGNSVELIEGEAWTRGQRDTASESLDVKFGRTEHARPRASPIPSDATSVLRALAKRLADSYVVHAQPSAMLLVGSAATGDADEYSDLDMLVYHDQVPADEAVAKTALKLGAEGYRGTPWSDESGEADERGYSERYSLDGVECQVGHISVGAFEREIARLVVDHELTEELLKIMSGLFEGVPLVGEDLIEQWRRKAAHTEELQRATIEKRWRFFPWWYFEERLQARDATAWRYDVLVQSTYAIVGVLAALNRLYFSTFEFKRASKFISRLEVAPANLAARLSTLFDSDERRSTAELERLVAETQTLVAERLPGIDLALLWSGKPTPPGERESPWTSPREQ